MRNKKNPEYPEFHTEKFSDGWKKYVKETKKAESEGLKLKIHGQNEIIKKQKNLIELYIKQMDKYRETIREQEILIINCAKCKFQIKREIKLKLEIPEVDNFISDKKDNLKFFNKLGGFIETDLQEIAIKWWWDLQNATRTLYVRMYCKDVDYASPAKVLEIYKIINLNQNQK